MARGRGRRKRGIDPATAASNRVAIRNAEEQFGTGETHGNQNWSQPVHGTTDDGRGGGTQRGQYTGEGS